MLSEKTEDRIQEPARRRTCVSLTPSTLAETSPEFHNCDMTEKEIVLETIRALPDNCSLDEIAERIEFMAAVQKGLNQLDNGEGIPHDEVKKQLASWLTS